MTWVLPSIVLLTVRLVFLLPSLMVRPLVLPATFTGLVPGGSYTARVACDCYPDGWSAAEEISWTMSLREGQVAQEVLVYPNPSNGNFRIQLNGYATDNLVIVITNAIGQVVYNNSMSVNESITVKEISLNDLAAGTIP